MALLSIIFAVGVSLSYSTVAANLDDSRIVFVREIADVNAKRELGMPIQFDVQFRLDEKLVTLQLTRRGSISDETRSFYGDAQKRALVSVKSDRCNHELRGHFTTKRGTFLIEPVSHNEGASKVVALLQKRAHACPHIVTPLGAIKRTECSDVEPTDECMMYNGEGMCTGPNLETEQWMYDNCRKTCQACDRDRPTR